MNKLDTEWFAENWRWVIFFSLMSLVIPSFIYHLATLDPELWSKESRKQVKEKFEKEIREIELPSKTAVNKFDSYEKHFSVFVNIRYRTEIGESEFVKNLKDQLEKKDWIYYGRGDSQNYLFCRGKADATLYSEGNGKLFSDGGNYFKLYFTLGMRPQIDFDNFRPTSCR